MFVTVSVITCLVNKNSNYPDIVAMEVEGWLMPHATIRVSILYESVCMSLCFKLNTKIHALHMHDKKIRY